MPPEATYEMEEEEEPNVATLNTMEVNIESSGHVAAPMSEEELSNHYDRQLPNFPEACAHNIRSFLNHGYTIHSTAVMQRHLMPALSTPGKINKYVASAGKYFMKKLEQMGIGDVSSAGKKAIFFRKRKWEDLDDRTIEVLNACGINSTVYKKSKK
jgi:hypothetical protein